MASDRYTRAWAAAVFFLLLLILEVALVRIDEGMVIPVLSPLLKFLRSVMDTILEFFRVGGVY